jgi:hypothetical protein
MSLRTTRLLGAVTAAGVALGGLGLAAPAALAASPSASATYTCATPLPGPLSSFQVPAQFSLESLPSALTANVPVPAGTPLVGTLDLSAAGLLPSVFLSLQSTIAMVLDQVPGSAQASGPINGAFTQLSGAAATVSGQLGAFTPDAGPLPVPIPTSFEFSNLVGPLSGLGVACKLNPGSVASHGGAVVTKQGAKLKAKAVHKVIRAGGTAVVKVKVRTTAGQRGVGQVVAKVKGGQPVTETLQNGRARFSFPDLGTGRHRISVRFSGNGWTSPAKKSVVVTVAR